MDSDDATVELRTAPKFKGFRQRWQSDLRSSVPETSVPSVQDVCEDPQLEPVTTLWNKDRDLIWTKGKIFCETKHSGQNFLLKT